MTLTTLFPRGNPLTESMPVSDRDGTSWLAYIEGVPGPPSYLQDRASLPGRRLRFDSAAESRVTTELPAGSPFLSEGRLQALLDQAELVPPTPTATWEPAESPFQQVRRAIADATGASKVGARELAHWARRWREGAGRRQALRRQVQGALAGAFHTIVGVIERIRSDRQDREPATTGGDEAMARRASLARRWRGARAHRTRPR
jgi:hypothetical protein